MENHLQYFKVSNFKCFEHLELNDLGKFNFIVGDNNVGKTSLLEALLFDDMDNDKDFNNFQNRLKYVLYHIRKLQNVNSYFLDYFVNRRNENWQSLITVNFQVKDNKGERHTIFEYHNKNNLKIEIYEKHNKVLSNENASMVNNVYDTLLPYVHQHLAYGDDLTAYYAKHLQTSQKQKKQFIDSLKTLIPHLTNLETSEIIDKKNALILYQDDIDASLPLATFGEGAIKLFRVLMEIIVWKNQRLMIDEIDNGLHHARLSDYLQTVLQTADTQNTQLFATTHNLECLQKLQTLLEKPENKHLQEKVRIIRLAHTKKQGITAYTYNYDKFEYAIENDLELR